MNRPEAGRLPTPTSTEVSRPFWDGCTRGEFLIQTCTACGYRHSTAQEFCRSCLSPALKWEPATGFGEIYSYTVVWRPQTEEFEVPYVVAIVELDEGPVLLTNVVDCDASVVEVGMRVEVTFRERGDVTLPMVRPAIESPS